MIFVDLIIVILVFGVVYASSSALMQADELEKLSHEITDIVVSNRKENGK